MLNIGQLNCNKGSWEKVRIMWVLSQNLSKRDCVMKYSQIFDPTGKIAPILGE